MYNRGNLATFTAWHEATKSAENITVFYSFTIAHSTNPDDYVWEHCAYPVGISYSKQEVINAGFTV